MSKEKRNETHLFSERPFVYRTGNTPGIAEAANCSQKGRRCRLTCSL